MTVAQLERSITMRELRDWAEFEADFGPLTTQERLDHAAAQISYVIHAVNAPPEKQVAPEKFLARWARSEPLTDEQIWAWLGAMANRGEK